MGKRNANPREGDADIVARVLAEAGEAKRAREGKDDKRGGDKKEGSSFQIKKVVVAYPEEPEKPQKEKFEGEKKVIEEALDALKAKLGEFKDQIKERTADKDEYMKERDGMKKALDEAQAESDRVFGEFSAVIQKIKDTREASRKADREYKDMARDVSSMGEDGIEQEIRKLSYEMSVKTMSLKEEKALMKRIALLEKEKPKLEKKRLELEALEAQRSGAADSKKPLSDQADSLKEQLEAAKAVKKEKAGEFRKLREEREKKTGNLKEKYGIMDAIKADMDQKRKELRLVKDGYKKLNDEHWDWKRACDKLKNDAWKQEEDARWDAHRAEEKKRKLEDAQEKPHFAETILIEQTIAYCKSLVKTEAKQEEEEYVVPENDAFPAGARMMIPKSQRDPTEGAYHQAKSKFKKNNKAKNREGKQKITMDPYTFKLFKELDVEAPLQVTDVPDCLEKLNKKMSFYDKKIAEWEKQKAKLAAELEADEKKLKENSAVVAGA